MDVNSAEEAGYAFEKGRLKAQKELHQEQPKSTVHEMPPSFSETPQIRTPKKKKKKHGIIFWIMAVLFFPISLSVWFWKTDRIRLKKIWRGLILALVWIFLIGSSDQREKKNGFNITSNTSYEFDGLTFSIPDYWGLEASNSTDNTKYFYAENGDATAMLVFSIQPDTEHFSLADSKKSFTDGMKDQFENGSVLRTEITTLLGKEALRTKISGRIDDRRTHMFSYTFFPDESNNLVSISLGQTTNTKYNYEDDFEKIIGTMTYSK